MAEVPGREDLPGEVWLPVSDWPYEVSDQGRVWSVPRKLSDGRGHGGCFLEPVPDGKGYLCVTLRDGWRRKEVRLHILVKRVHTGPSRGRQVRHVKDDKTDNRLTALKYGTARQNARDKNRNRKQKETEREEERREGTGEKRLERGRKEKQEKTAGASRVPAIVSGCLTEGSR